MSQEATVRTVNEIIDWFKIGKEVHQGCILDPSYGSSAGKESACNVEGWVQLLGQEVLLEEG